MEISRVRGQRKKGSGYQGGLPGGGDTKAESERGEEPEMASRVREQQVRSLQAGKRLAGV